MNCFAQNKAKVGNDGWVVNRPPINNIINRTGNRCLLGQKSWGRRLSGPEQTSALYRFHPLHSFEVDKPAPPLGTNEKCEARLSVSKMQAETTRVRMRTQAVQKKTEQWPETLKTPGWKRRKNKDVYLSVTPPNKGPTRRRTGKGTCLDNWASCSQGHKITSPSRQMEQDKSATDGPRSASTIGQKKKKEGRKRKKETKR